MLRNSSVILILSVNNITLVLRFMKSKKFYCVQVGKVVKAKDVSC